MHCCSHALPRNHAGMHTAQEQLQGDIRSCIAQQRCDCCRTGPEQELWYPTYPFMQWIAEASQFVTAALVAVQQTIRRHTATPCIRCIHPTSGTPQCTCLGSTQHPHLTRNPPMRPPAFLGMRSHLRNLLGLVHHSSCSRGCCIASSRHALARLVHSIACSSGHRLQRAAQVHIE